MLEIILCLKPVRIERRIVCYVQEIVEDSVSLGSYEIVRYNEVRTVFWQRLRLQEFLRTSCTSVSNFIITIESRTKSLYSYILYFILFFCFVLNVLQEQNTGTKQL